MNTKFVVNDDINHSEVRLIDENGQQVGIVRKEVAINLAKDKGYDLLQVAEQVDGVVCKIVNLGRHKYNLDKTKKQKNKSAKQKLKEVTLTPRIAENDLNVKIKKIDQFISEGNKVKITMTFSGREIVYAESGKAVFDKIVSSVNNACFDGPIQQFDRKIIATITKKRS